MDAPKRERGEAKPPPALRVNVVAGAQGRSASEGPGLFSLACASGWCGRRIAGTRCYSDGRTLDQARGGILRACRSPKIRGAWASGGQARHLESGARPKMAARHFLLPSASRKPDDIKAAKSLTCVWKPGSKQRDMALLPPRKTAIPPFLRHGVMPGNTRPGKATFTKAPASSTLGAGGLQSATVIKETGMDAQASVVDGLSPMTIAGRSNS
jgi:hypothetical protein